VTYNRPLRRGRSTWQLSKGDINVRASRLEVAACSNAGLVDRATPVREIVPGLGQVEWTLGERLAHAEEIRIVHGPNRTLVRARRAPTFRMVSKGNCRTCGEAWICSYAVWSAAVRAVAAMRQQALR
jgi:hypothetical protein